jgi:hypothetical protein
MSIRRLAVLFLPILALTSCAPRREGVLLDTTKTPALRLAAMVRAADAQILTLRGRGSIAFDTPEMGGTVAFDLSLRKPDSVLVSLEGPFGIDVGSFFLGHGHFVLYNSMQNAFASGVPTRATLRSLIPVDLTSDEIVSAFSGSFPLPANQEPLSYSVDDDQFVLEYSCGEDTCAFRIDPELLMVRHYTRTDHTGAIVIEGETTGSIEHSGQRIPRRVILSMPQEQRRVTVVFSAADFNTDDLSFSFDIPPNARRMNGTQ